MGQADTIALRSRTDNPFAGRSHEREKPDTPGDLATMNERDLFALHLRGDHDAFMEIFNRHHRRIYLYCAKVIGDDRLAHDTAQELWEKVIVLRTKRVTLPDRPLGFLLTMARNLCISHHRRKRPTIPLDVIDESQHPSTAQGESSRLEEFVKAALTKLPAIQREVLVLNAYSGYGFDEIAEMLERPPGAVHTIAWRARKKLAEIVREMIDREHKEAGGNDRHDTRRETP